MRVVPESAQDLVVSELQMGSQLIDLSSFAVFPEKTFNMEMLLVHTEVLYQDKDHFGYNQGLFPALLQLNCLK